MSRLVWFQHFHKSAGSYVVDTALRNGEQLYPHNANGNPLDPTSPRGKKALPLHTYDEGDLRAFVAETLAQGVTFVATEWFSPDFAALQEVPEVVTVTLLRDPLDRLVSNFRFDAIKGWAKSDGLEGYVGSAGIHTHSNYYCRILSNRLDRGYALQEPDRDAALANLRAIDQAAHVEDPDGLRDLFRWLGWERGARVRRNSTGLTARDVVKHLRTSDFRGLRQRVVHRHLEPSVAFADQFYRENSWDYELYRAVATDR